MTADRSKSDELALRNALTDRRRTRPSSSFFHPDWPLTRQLAQDTDEAIRLFAHGDVLDVGAGRAPYRAAILPRARSYVTMDVSPGQGIDIVGSAMDIPFPAARFDTIFCAQVLEHVPDPVRVVAEFARVLRPGGHAILSVPQYWPQHESPFDYQRLTIFGLEELARRHGFSIIHRRRQGGGFAVAGQAVNNVLAERLHFGDDRYSRRSKLIRAALIVPFFVLSNLAFGALDRALPSRDDTLNHVVVLRLSSTASA